MKMIFKPMIWLFVGTFTFTSCMGSFALTKKLYKWNEGVTNNKYLNNVIYWLLGGVQAYTATLFIDGVILNLIEFWSGSNPLAFAPDFEGTDRLAYQGKVYELERSSDKLIIRELDGKTMLAMEKAADGTWMALNGEEKLPMFRENGDHVTFYHNAFSIEMKQEAVTTNPFIRHVSPQWVSR